MRTLVSAAIFLCAAFVVFAGAALAGPVGAVSAAAPCPAPHAMHFEVTAMVRRADLGFTEGLEMHGGALYESTGDEFGTSHIERFDPASGRGTMLFDAGRAYFGEGLTVWNGQIYQLSWQEHRVFIHDLKGRLLRELSNPREGWGLTHDATRLITSDGSDRLFFIAAGDFATLGSVAVMDGKTPVANINELEYVDGAVYANIFLTPDILRISPATGCVEAMADLSGLRQHMSEADRRHIDFDENYVLNGIAYDPATRLFTLTGKYWPMFFTGRFVEDGP